MGIIKDIYSLKPQVAKKAEQFIQICAERDVPVFITETMRLPEIQMLYYLQGRIDRKNIQPYNKLRKLFGLWEVSQTEALNKVITWTLDSNHMTGNAFDFCPMKDGKLDWNASADTWEKCGEIAESLGFVWGGRWTPKDMPHVEWVDK